MTLNERLRYFRKEILGMNQRQFASALGMAQTSVSAFEADGGGVSDRVLKTICTMFNVREEWLRTGEGEMYSPEPVFSLDRFVAERGATDRAGLSIEVKPGFDGNGIDVELVTTIEAAEAALAGGAESVTISEPISGTIDIPATAVQDVTLTLMGLSGDITISGEEYSGMVTLNNLVQPETPVDLTIDIPNGSFMLGRGTWSNVTVSTADNTFILGEDVTISGTLTVNKGNVEIYGRVENIEFKDENSLVTVFTVYDAESLEYAASLVPQSRCAKIVLGADIDLQGSAENKWEPIDAENTKFTELDGAGHTISNLYVDNATGNQDADPNHYGGLFYVLQGKVLAIEQW